MRKGPRPATTSRPRVINSGMDEIGIEQDRDAIESLYEEGIQLIGQRVDVHLHDRIVTGRLDRIRIDSVALSDGASFAPGEVEGISSSRE